MTRAFAVPCRCGAGGAPRWFVSLVSLQLLPGPRRRGGGGPPELQVRSRSPGRFVGPFSPPKFRFSGYGLCQARHTLAGGDLDANLPKEVPFPETLPFLFPKPRPVLAAWQSPWFLRGGGRRPRRGRVPGAPRPPPGPRRPGGARTAVFPAPFRAPQVARPQVTPATSLLAQAAVWSSSPNSSEIRGRGGRAGAEIWGKPRFPGPNASRYAPAAVHSGPPPPRRAALAPLPRPPCSCSSP